MYVVIIKNVKSTMLKFLTLRGKKKNRNKGWFRSGSLVNIILYTYKGRMIQFKYKHLKINGDVNITGNRRALAEGKEGSISFHSESKCFFFHHGHIPQNFEFGLGSIGSVSRFLRLLFKLTSLSFYLCVVASARVNTLIL